MNNAYIVDAIRTPIGRYGGALSAVRADDLAAAPIRALIERQTALDRAAVEDIFYG
jgi:acetyl-CoA acetyltransferase